MTYYNVRSNDSTGKDRLFNYKNINKSCLSALVNDVPLGIVIADRDGFIKRANSTWMKMFGYSLCNNAIPNFLDYRYKYDRNRDSVLLKSLFDREIEHYNIERKYIRKDGSELWCNTSARLIDSFDTANIHVIGAYIDITEYKNTVNELQGFHNKLEEIVSERTDEIKKLNIKVMKSQEIERQRIARDLHDGVGQTILAAKYAMDSFLHSGLKDTDFFKRGMALIEIASQELREVYSGLYPSMLSDLGLNETIRWFIRNYLEPLGLKVDYNFDVASAIANDLSLNLYRISQELFNNIIKHSGADYTSINITDTGDSIRIKVSDNGSGFESDNILNKTDGMGLINICHRVESLHGHMSIKSGKRGTSVFIELPMKLV